jgi:hypothetical protein
MSRPILSPFGGRVGALTVYVADRYVSACRDGERRPGPCRACHRRSAPAGSWRSHGRPPRRANLARLAFFRPGPQAESPASQSAFRNVPKASDPSRRVQTISRRTLPRVECGGPSLPCGVGAKGSGDLRRTPLVQEPLGLRRGRGRVEVESDFAPLRVRRLDLQLLASLDQPYPATRSLGPPRPAQCAAT